VHPEAVRAGWRSGKKLKVAFHFYAGNPAGWECEPCRKQGLEKQRRCAWLDAKEQGQPQVVWTRNGVRSEHCPRSVITGESAGWVSVYPLLGPVAEPSEGEWTPRDLEAFSVLRREEQRLMGSGLND
jgi:hypothetical protein